MRMILALFRAPFLPLNHAWWSNQNFSWFTVPSYIVIGATVLLAIFLPLTAPAQMIFAGTLLAFALYLYNRNGRLTTIVLILTGLLLTFRYFSWRVTHTLDLTMSWDLVMVIALILAELFGLAVIILNSILMIWPLQRQSTPLPALMETWPTVDVFVTSYNEPIEVVRATLIAAQNMLWPKNKLRVYLLDDGRRPAFRAMSAELGAGYLTRPDNQHAKAGNLNAAFKVTDGELIAVFDADFRPTCNFLLETTGGFLRQQRLFLVQTPHHFFFADPFDRNLGVHRQVPQENDIFQQAIQDGKDIWGAAFFCGSSAVLRRQALNEIGGFAVETVTEDAHTSLKLHRRGWHSAYLSRRLSAGYSTETLADFIQQRIRWARGTMQILHLEGLWQHGMGVTQNLGYIANYLNYLSALPRFIFFIAPIAFLLFGLQAIHAPATMILAYALPAIFMSQLVSSRLFGQYRHTFWGDVYEMVTCWHTIRPTLMALFGKKFNVFNVTPKGQRLEHGYFDHSIVKPLFILIIIAWLAAFIAIWRLFTNPGDWFGAILLNLFWDAYNIIILSVALAAAWEHPQRRESPRIAALDLLVTLNIHGQHFAARVEDASLLGMRIKFAVRGCTSVDGGRCQHPAMSIVGQAPQAQDALERLTHPTSASMHVVGRAGICMDAGEAKKGPLPDQLTQDEEITVYIGGEYPPTNQERLNLAGDTTSKVTADYGIPQPECVPLRSRVAIHSGDTLTLCFPSLNLPQERWLNWNLFGRIDAWQHPGYSPDSFFKSFSTVFRIALCFYRDLWRQGWSMLMTRYHNTRL